MISSEKYKILLEIVNTEKDMLGIQNINVEQEYPEFTNLIDKLKKHCDLNEEDLEYLTGLLEYKIEHRKLFIELHNELYTIKHKKGN